VWSAIPIQRPLKHRCRSKVSVFLFAVHGSSSPRLWRYHRDASPRVQGLSRWSPYFMPGVFTERGCSMFGRQNGTPPTEIGAPSELSHDRPSRIKRRCEEAWPSMFMRRGNSKSEEGSLFQCLLAMAAAATTAMIFSIISGINWQFGRMLMGAAAALAGATLFTFLEMRRLGRSSLVHELSPSSRHGASGGQDPSIKSNVQRDESVSGGSENGTVS